MGGQERLWTNARLATLDPSMPGLGVIEHGAIQARDGRLAYVGPRDALPGDAVSGAAEIVDCGGRWITPAPIDCHTHLVHGGNRAREFAVRLDGMSYEAIAGAGGGIASTVEATRGLGVEGLAASALPRLDALLREGTSTVEVKSGYGLEIEAELDMLRAARALGRARPVRVRTSWLAAHAVPAEHAGRPADYIADVVLPGMERGAAEGLIDAVDGFCEAIAFSPAEIARVFDKAKALRLPVKLHAEQLSDLGGARLAAFYGALSADHLEHLGDDGVAAMASSGTVAVLLPGAFYALRETRAPPVAALRAARVSMAIATDCNPGTSPLTSLLLAMNMGATLFRMTVDECLAGVTREAARALGLLGETGTLEVGKSADLAVWDVESLAELAYRMGFNPLHARVFKGERTAA